LSHDRLAGALVAEADRFGTAIAGAAPDTRVPTCPEWTLRDLACHVGVAYHKSAAIIASRPTGYVPFEAVTIDDPPAFEALGGWLHDGAERLVAAVAEVGAETPTSTWTPDRRAGFWTRRLTHETVVHRADAAFATGRPYDVDADLAAAAAVVPAAGSGAKGRRLERPPRSRPRATANSDQAAQGPLWRHSARAKPVSAPCLRINQLHMSGGVNPQWHRDRVPCSWARSEEG